MENNNRGIKTFGLLFLLVVTFSLGILFGRTFTSPAGGLLGVLNSREADVDMSLFWEVWNVMESRYVEKDKVDLQDKVYGAIKGLVDSYEDPATIFLNPEETQQFNDSNEGKYFEGIGAELGYEDGAIVVVSPLDGSPAKSAGIRAGDYILAVDDVEISQNANIYEVVDMIRGESGSTVKLRILHKGELAPTDIEITRGEITVPSMSVEFIGENSNVAVIDIARFTDSSYSAWIDKWDQVVEEVNRRGIKKVIVDLRGNPGGYFDAAVYAADDFLSKDTVIAKQEDGNGRVETFSAKNGGRLLDTEVVVLVDAGSASASEIFAGALQKNDRAQVVGTKTYGKGTAQSVLDLSNGATLHVTVLKWLLPDGEWLNRENPIVPDVEVENTTDDFVKGLDPQREKALELISK